MPMVKPVIGATVMEKGNASNGTVTDIDGNYAIKVKRGATLTISYIGYISQETKGGDVTLQEDFEVFERSSRYRLWYSEEG